MSFSEKKKKREEKESLGMPSLHIICQRAVQHFTKQHKYHGICQFSLLLSRPVTCRRGLKTTSLQSKTDNQEKTFDKFGSRRSALNFDTLGSWDNKVDLPVNIETSIKYGKLIPDILVENVGVVSLLGRRKVNEDRYKISEIRPNLLMFAMYDGHGGHHAADFVCEHMENHISFWLDRGEKNLSKILRTAFIDVNNAFARHLYYNYIGELY